jgi:hypothetical protein
MCTANVYFPHLTSSGGAAVAGRLDRWRAKPGAWRLRGKQDEPPIQMATLQERRLRANP